MLELLFESFFTQAADADRDGQVWTSSYQAQVIEAMALQTILLYPVYPTLSTQTKIILICPTLSKQIILPGVKRRVPNHDLDRNRRPEASWTTRPVPGLTFFFFLSFVFFFFVFSVVLSFVIITTLFKLAEEREKTFAKMDENGDGSIAFNEWLAFFLQVGQKLEPESFVWLIDGFDGFENEIGCID